MRTVGILAGAVALVAAMPALAQAPAPGTATQPGAWGRHGWVSGNGAQPPVAGPAAGPATVPAAAVPPAAAPVVVPTPTTTPTPTPTPMPVLPTPGTVRTGPNSTVTTSVETVAPPAVIGGVWNGAQVLSVTPGYVVTTTTRSSEVIRQPSPASRSVRARR